MPAPSLYHATAAGDHPDERPSAYGRETGFMTPVGFAPMADFDDDADDHSMLLAEAREAVDR